jgi:hypothetical protein
LSLFPPTRGGLQFAFADTITVAFDDGDIGVMEQPVKQRDDAGSVRKDFVPFLEGTIGGQDQRLPLITPVDDLIEKVRRLVVEGQIPDFIGKRPTKYRVAEFAAVVI